MYLKIYPPPKAQRKRALSYASGKGFYEGVVTKLRRGLIGLDFGSSNILLIVKKFAGQLATPPLSPIISPNTSNQNFEISIIFSVVKRSDNSALRMKITRALRARVVSYAMGAHKVCIERVVVETYFV